jgi:hypothetical protein
VSHVTAADRFTIRYQLLRATDERRRLCRASLTPDTCQRYRELSEQIEALLDWLCEQAPSVSRRA